MEPVMNLNCFLPTECTSLSPSALIWQDVMAQAMTGELYRFHIWCSRRRSCTRAKARMKSSSVRGPKGPLFHQVGTHQLRNRFSRRYEVHRLVGDL
jgi:hypothetical protein